MNTAIKSKNSKIRFQVRENETAYSDRWTAFCRGNDVYIAEAGLGATSKVSLHESGVCRYAINSNLASHNPPLSSDDRVISKWQIGPYFGEEHSQVLRLLFLPWTYRASSGYASNKQSIALAYPPRGGAIEVSVFYSETNPLEWNSKRWPTSNIFRAWHLKPKCFVCFRSRVTPVDEQTIDFVSKMLNSNDKIGMMVGEENQELMPIGIYTSIVSSSTPTPGTPHCCLGYPNNTVLRASWSTKSGHKKAD